MIQLKKNISNKPAIFSFFAGVGFLDLGFEDAGFPIKYVNEYHKPFMEIYKCARKNFQTDEPEYYLGDIENILRFDEKKKFDEIFIDIKKQNDLIGFIGGPPCPDFSIGGKNRGKNGINGRLSAVYVKLIIEKKPDFFLFENVKGLWRTKKHREFYEKLKSDLRESGYILTDKLINCIEAGVPQNRERIILIGFHKEKFKNFESLSDETKLNKLFPWNKYFSLNKKEIFSLNWPSTNEFCPDSYYEPPPEIEDKLTVQYWFELNKVYEHPNSIHHFQPRAGLKRFLTVPEGDDSRKSYKRLHRWRYSPTACYGNNEVHLHPYKPRRISVAEALAIQSLPREFIIPDHISLSDMFKAIGNGVPYLTSRAISKSISDFIEKIIYDTSNSI